MIKNVPTKQKDGLDFLHLNPDTEPRLKKIDLPGEIIIPMKQGFGSETIPLPEVGAEIQAGQMIGTDEDSLCSPIHSSVSGKFTGKTEINYIRENTYEPLEEEIVGLRVSVKNDELKHKLECPGPNWDQAEPAQLREILYQAGVSAVGIAGIPTGFNSSLIDPQQVNQIVVNCLTTEPFIHHADLLTQKEEQFISGIKILGSAFPQAEINLILNETNGNRSLTNLEGVKTHALPGNHPQGNPTLVAASLFHTSNDLSAEQLLSQQGTLFLPPQSPLLVFEAVVEGKPFTRTKVSVGGCIEQSLIMDAPLGTPLSTILEQASVDNSDLLCLLGGPLTGLAQKDTSLPVGKDINSIVVLQRKGEREFLPFLRPGRGRKSFTNTFLSSLLPGKVWEKNADYHGEERPCISCGFCRDVCPVDILPFQIYKTASHDLIDETKRLNPNLCIKCGLCSYVCPSKLPLTSTIGKAKTQFSDEKMSTHYVRRQGRLIALPPKQDQQKQGEKSEHS